MYKKKACVASTIEKTKQRCSQNNHIRSDNVVQSEIKMSRHPYKHTSWNYFRCSIDVSVPQLFGEFDGISSLSDASPNEKSYMASIPECKEAMPRHFLNVCRNAITWSLKCSLKKSNIASVRCGRTQSSMKYEALDRYSNLLWIAKNSFRISRHCVVFIIRSGPIIPFQTISFLEYRKHSTETCRFSVFQMREFCGAKVRIFLNSLLIKPLRLDYASSENHNFKT